MGKVARTSNLAVRFYESDGWTKAELDTCCVLGEFRCHFPSDNFKYFTLTAQSTYDVDKLLVKISVIKRRFPDQAEKTDRELLEHMNW